MNEKAKAELTRQLSEGLHFFVRCCDWSADTAARKGRT
jgi:hypothetical protein